MERVEFFLSFGSMCLAGFFSLDTSLAFLCFYQTFALVNFLLG